MKCCLVTGRTQQSKNSALGDSLRSNRPTSADVKIVPIKSASYNITHTQINTTFLSQNCSILPIFRAKSDQNEPIIPSNTTKIMKL